MQSQAEQQKHIEMALDPNYKIKTLIEEKYLGKVSNWQMGYIYQPKNHSPVDRLDAQVQIPIRRLIQQRHQTPNKVRTGSHSEQFSKGTQKQTSYWLTNIKLKRSVRPKVSPVPITTGQLRLEGFHRKTKSFVKQNQSKMSVCDDGDSIIDYYRTKYENSDMRVQSQQSIAKKRNLPRIQPIGEVCLNIDPW